MSTAGLRMLMISGICIFYFSCKQKEDNNSLPPPTVNAVIVGKEDISVHEEYIGQIYGESDVQIQPRVEGSITGIYFKEGDVVAKGKLLYTIDDLPTKTKIDAAKADIGRAQAILENKKSDLSRIQPLTEMKALSQRDLDAAQAAYKVCTKTM